MMMKASLPPWLATDLANPRKRRVNPNEEGVRMPSLFRRSWKSFKKKRMRHHHRLHRPRVAASPKNGAIVSIPKSHLPPQLIREMVIRPKENPNPGEVAKMVPCRKPKKMLRTTTRKLPNLPPNPNNGGPVKMAPCRRKILATERNPKVPDINDPAVMEPIRTMTTMLQNHPQSPKVPSRNDPVMMEPCRTMKMLLETGNP
mmetsp:Transcript_32578/g.67946  ORF Transcript_32578/g.67946 Transcript_32578/m.67946 type:complete len:201 (-) Transcript_32578:2860-3462(-)